MTRMRATGRAGRESDEAGRSDTDKARLWRAPDGEEALRRGTCRVAAGQALGTGFAAPSDTCHACSRARDVALFRAQSGPAGPDSLGIASAICAGCGGTRHTGRRRPAPPLSSQSPSTQMPRAVARAGQGF